MRTAALVIVIASGGAIALLSVAWPLAALTQVMVEAPWISSAFGERRWELLLRGMRVAFLSAVVAAVLGGGLATGLAARPRSSLRSLSNWAALATLLTPPYVHAYAWSITLLPSGALVGTPSAARLPSWLVHDGRAVWCLATWLAPIAAALLAGGWRLAGRGAYRMALLEADGWRSLRSAALSAMSPWIGLALLVPFLLATTEYSVCHLSQVQTLNTEILAELQNSTAGALALAWPFLTLIAFLVAGLFVQRRRIAEFLADAGGLRENDDSGGAGRRPRAAAIVPLTAIALLLLPWPLLVARLDDPAALVRVWRTFPHDWPAGLRQAAVAALAAGVLAIAADALISAVGGARRRSSALLLRAPVACLDVALLLLAVLPPALVGLAFMGSAGRVPWLRDQFWIVSAVNVARFGLIALFALRIASGSERADLLNAVRAEGANWATAYWQIRLPRSAGMLGRACAVVGVLALTEVAASTLVSPPGMPGLALTLLNQIHFGRNDDVIALCLSVMVFVALACAGAARLHRR